MDSASAGPADHENVNSGCVLYPRSRDTKPQVTLLRPSTYHLCIYLQTFCCELHPTIDIKPAHALPRSQGRDRPDGNTFDSFNVITYSSGYTTYSADSAFLVDALAKNQSTTPTTCCCGALESLPLADPPPSARCPDPTRSPACLRLTRMDPAVRRPRIPHGVS